MRLGDRYRALKPIGHGGFGKTFLAIDEHRPFQPKCVIKQFCPENLDTQRLAKAQELFYQEAVRLEVLGHHPQIPQLLAHFSQPPYHYLVQSYVDGQNLAQELALQGAFSEQQIYALLRSLLPVLQFIHDRQVIHRDVKPANIIRQRVDQQLVLVDFGAAKHASTTALYQTGTVIGSAGYAAPEQAGGKAVFASDLYSLGVTCVHLLTNVPPFDLYSFADGAWVWRDYLPTPISPQLGVFLDRLLHPAISQRFPTAAAAMERLDVLKLGPPKSERRPPPVPRMIQHPDVIPPSSLPIRLTSQPLVWRCIHTLSAHANSVAAIAMSPTGKMFASASFDRTIKVWHLGTGALISTLEGHRGPVLALVFSPDGRSLISGSVDNTIRVWDLETETLQYPLTDHVGTSMALAMALSPDGQAIVTGSDDHTVRIWQISSGKLMRTIQHPRAVTAVDLSSDSRYLISGCSDNLVRIWDFSTGDLLHRLDAHKRDVNCVATYHQLLVSGSSDNTVKLWDLESGVLKRSLIGHLDWVRAVAISPNGQLLASAGDDHTIKLWSMPHGTLLHTLTGTRDGHRRAVNAIAFSPDSRTLVSGSGDRTLKIWRYQ
jgi:serine/threonine protein kinase